MGYQAWQSHMLHVISLNELQSQSAGITGARRLVPCYTYELISRVISFNNVVVENVECQITSAAMIPSEATKIN